MVLMKCHSSSQRLKEVGLLTVSPSVGIMFNTWRANEGRLLFKPKVLQLCNRHSFCVTNPLVYLNPTIIVGSSGEVGRIWKYNELTRCDYETDDERDEQISSPHSHNAQFVRQLTKTPHCGVAVILTLICTPHQFSNNAYSAHSEVKGTSHLQ